MLLWYYLGRLDKWLIKIEHKENMKRHNFLRERKFNGRIWDV